VTEPLTPVEPTAEVAKRNIALALSLLGLAIFLAVGALVVALVYLHYD
jgi:lipopolysaccharide/colanic/teichoic acid biosynthesis glycosyltransferase